MSMIAAVDSARAMPESKQLLDAVQAKLGMTPNLFKVMAHSPKVLGAYLGFSEALGNGKLDAKLRERIALAVAEQNRCGYCLSAHVAIGKMVGLDEGEIDRARDGGSADSRAQAALVFANKLVQSRGAVSAGDVQAIRAARYGEAEILEIVAVVAVNILTNYVNLVAQTEIDFPNIALRGQRA